MILWSIFAGFITAWENDMVKGRSALLERVINSLIDVLHDLPRLLTIVQPAQARQEALEELL